MKDHPRILIIAGEVSGDAHAARVLSALKEKLPGVEAWGFGGDRLAEEGMEIREHIRELSVMGIWEVLKRYGYFKRIFHELLAEVKQNPPDLILLVDYPGFNLRFAEAVQHLNIPVVQYVCPQVWAWKKSRIPKMAKVLDSLICIFPFEPAVFSGVDLDVRYCGHPLVEETAEVVALSGWEPERPKLVLVPGSRAQEIERLFLPMLETAERIQKQMPEVQIRVSAADEERRSQIEEILRGRGEGDLKEKKEEGEVVRLGQTDLQEVDIVVGEMRELVKGADAALVTSGTATLETALLGTPMLIVYKTSALTYAVGKRVVKVSYIGMVNLIAGREVCPEFIQDAAQPARMAEALAPLLRTSPERTIMLDGLSEVRAKLVSDEGGARVAEVLMECLNNQNVTDL